MKKYIAFAITTVLLLYSTFLNGQTSMLFSGGPLYDNIKEHAHTVKTSGFNTLVLWSMHINDAGDLIYNGPTIISNGEYVGHDWWPEEVNNLLGEGSSIKRIEFSIGAWGVPDFEKIQSLMKEQGTGPNSILYKNFKKLKEILPIEAIDFDDESNYDVASTVEFSKMLIELGYKITLCPYKKKSFWKSVYHEVNEYKLGSIDRVYLQCYAGGANNAPAEWNKLFNEINVIPGLWCKNGTDCSSGDSPQEVRSKLESWKENSAIDGGFIWFFDDLIKCGAGTSTDDYAKAILEAVKSDAE